MNYKIVSIVEYQPVPGVEAPKEKLVKVTFWHPDNIHQGVMVTELPPDYDDEWIQQRIQEFMDSPSLVNFGQPKPGPSETKDAANKT